MIQVLIKNNEIGIYNSVTLTSGTKGQKCAFSFGPEWNELTKTIIFKAGDMKCALINIQSNEIIIPTEALAQAGVPLEIGAQGLDAQGELRLVTPYAHVGLIAQGAEMGEEIVEPALPVWEQIFTLTQETAAAVKEISALADGGDLDKEVTK